MIVDLAHSLPDPPTSARMRERLPNLAALMTDEQLTAMDTEPRYRVLGTRDLARLIIAANPDAVGEIVLDAHEVAVASTPFLGELLKAWPAARIVNANEDVQESWDIASEDRPRP